jgi:hypothetical protein
MPTYFGDVPGVEVILDLEPPLMLEAFASGLRRRVDYPFYWGGELADELGLCEELDDKLT